MMARSRLCGLMLICTPWNCSAISGRALPLVRMKNIGIGTYTVRAVCDQRLRSSAEPFMLMAPYEDPAPSERPGLSLSSSHMFR